MHAHESLGAARVTLAPPEPLTLEALGEVASGAIVALGADVAGRMAASHRHLQALAASGRPVYGLTTGCGPLVDRAVAGEARAEFQRNLVRSHASGLGRPHPEPAVRATMAARAFSLAQGRSGIRVDVVETLLAMLNAGIHPVVPEIGSVGASGDLVELAHVAHALIGEGEVEFRGARQPAAAAMRAAGLVPIVLEGREGLALMNGTSCETAQGALLVLGAETLVAAAEAAAALVFDVLAGNPETFDPRVHAARPHPGQVASAARLRRLLAGSARVRDTPARGGAGGEPPRPLQDAYTLRCIPQVLGAVRATVAHVRSVVEIELNGVTDNPLLFAEDDVALHGGNFHGQPVALAADHLKVALAEIALFSERRLARLLDPATSGLPPFLIGDRAGVRSGLMGLQYCASSTIAEGSVLAHPASLGSVPTNANNQDVVGMGGVAVRQARTLLDNARRVVAIELLAAAEAADLVGTGALAQGTRAVHAAVRAVVPRLSEDRPLGRDVERLVDVLARVAAIE
jgi:histidine ammonia-lyase